jgi:cytoskeletal protein RodZ
VSDVGPGAGERWNVNLPAVVGVVFVFLLAVILWVVASGGRDDALVPTDTTLIAEPTTTTSPPSTTSLTTTPQPMPDLSSTTTLPTSSVTTAPGAVADAVPGDLAVPGRPMQQPECNGAFITLLASAVGDQATATAIANVLSAYPASNYLRTDQTCSSLRPDVDGEPIYVIYFGPFADAADACAARGDGPAGAYVKQLSDDVDPAGGVSCS